MVLVESIQFGMGGLSAGSVLCKVGFVAVFTLLFIFRCFSILLGGGLFYRLWFSLLEGGAVSMVLDICALVLVDIASVVVSLCVLGFWGHS